MSQQFRELTASMAGRARQGDLSITWKSGGFPEFIEACKGPWNHKVHLTLMLNLVVGVCKSLPSFHKHQWLSGCHTPPQSDTCLFHIASLTKPLGAHRPAASLGPSESALVLPSVCQLYGCRKTSWCVRDWLCCGNCLTGFWAWHLEEDVQLWLLTCVRRTDSLPRTLVKQDEAGLDLSNHALVPRCVDGLFQHFLRSQWLPSGWREI